MRVSNEEIREISNTRTFDEFVRSRRWKWLGHVLRMSLNMNPKIALTWSLEGKETASKDRATWKKMIDCHILHRERKDDDDDEVKNFPSFKYLAK